MALDTDTRKFSAINLGSPWRGICNIPAGALDEPEWFSIVGLYNEFAAGEAPPDDTTPDQFTFGDKFGVATSATITSDPVTITGIDAAADITVSGGTYDINASGSFVSTPGTVNNGDTVRARHTSSGSASTAVNTVVTVGGVSDTFTSTTAGVANPSETGIISIIVRRNRLLQ